jgi:hypothetical protein
MINVKDWNKLELDQAEVDLCVSFQVSMNNAADEREKDRYEILFIETLVQLGKKYGAHPQQILEYIITEVQKGENK